MSVNIARHQIIQASRLPTECIAIRSLAPPSCRGLGRDLAQVQPNATQRSSSTRLISPQNRPVQPTRSYSSYQGIRSHSRPSYNTLRTQHTPSFSTTPQRLQATTPKIPLQIRPIQASDESAFISLWSQYNDFYKRTIPAEVTETTFKRFLDPNIRMYAAVAVDTSSDNKIVGFITWYPHLSTSSIKEQVYAHDAFVDPSVRNMGAARALIEYVYEHARTEIGASLVYWHTQHYNHRAQLLYVKVADRTDFVKYQKNL